MALDPSSLAVRWTIDNLDLWPGYEVDYVKTAAGTFAIGNTHMAKVEFSASTSELRRVIWKYGRRASQEILWDGKQLWS